MLKEFNDKYKDALVSIRCPNCGCHLGLVRGQYNFRCSKCKEHKIIYGNTETNEQYIK